MTKNLIAYAKKYLARVYIMPCAPVDTSLLPISGHMGVALQVHTSHLGVFSWWSGAHYWPPEAAVCTYILLLPVSVSHNLVQVCTCSPASLSAFFGLTFPSFSLTKGRNKANKSHYAMQWHHSNLPRQSFAPLGNLLLHWLAVWPAQSPCTVPPQGS